MNGPEHYREAERLNARAYHFAYGDGCDVATGAAFAAMAQVHATLALAAAQALSTTDYSRENGAYACMPWEDGDAWLKAAGVRGDRS